MTQDAREEERTAYDQRFKERLTEFLGELGERAH